MLKVYRVDTSCGSGQVHCVVAKNMADAEAKTLAEYPTATIEEIKLYSGYVLLALGINED